jgi:cytochrome c biogenesis protein ccsA
MKLKILLIATYLLLILVMATATIIEKYCGTAYVSETIYGSLWFALLWALLAAGGTTFILRSKMRRWNVGLLHLSLLVILIGAALTRLTAYTGSLHLREGQTTRTFLHKQNGEKGQLPFSVRLNRFRVVFHEGTEAAADYESDLTLQANDQQKTGRVSMNRILTFHGVRLYQSSFDADRHGCTFAVNADPYGIPVTYAGYLMLFIAFAAVLFDPRGTFRRLLRSRSLGSVLLFVLLLIPTTGIAVAPTLPKEQAERFGRIYVNYNHRICPLQTLAIDFTRKLCGSSSYNGYTPEQVLLGFIFWGNNWGNEPLIRVKRGELREVLHLSNRASTNDFFSMGSYRLATPVEEFYGGAQDGFHQQAADLDDRIRLILELRRGTLLKVFPHRQADGRLKWYAPTEKLPASVDSLHQLYIRQLFSILNRDVQRNDLDHFDDLVLGLRKYQIVNGRESLPSPIQTRAERLYNSLPFVTLLFIFNLTLALLLLLRLIYRLSRHPSAIPSDPSRWINRAGGAFMALSWAVLSLVLGLRWIVSGSIPLSNGYETMLSVTWFVQLLALGLHRRVPIVLLFGFLLSGFFLLVSHISRMDPAISHLMPVLNSPLLSIHVSIIMMSYALLSLTFICGLTALLLHQFSKSAPALHTQLQALHVLSRLFLYPALATLALGIFVGAVWANISWGQYWSWDPKEVWALITLMVYSVAVHTHSLPRLHRPLVYHLYMVVAFLTVLMTYFGVNYFLGGMHSYA